ncbi:hypothetical protein PAMA_008442 [Pampus argenteus]
MLTGLDILLPPSLFFFNLPLQTCFSPDSHSNLHRLTFHFAYPEHFFSYCYKCCVKLSDFFYLFFSPHLLSCKTRVGSGRKDSRLNNHKPHYNKPLSTPTPCFSEVQECAIMRHILRRIATGLQVMNEPGMPTQQPGNKEKCTPGQNHSQTGSG